MTAPDRHCPVHLDAAVWITMASNRWTYCRECQRAKRLAWAQTKRAAGTLKQSTPEYLAARRERAAWKGVHDAYLDVCDRLGIV